MLGEVREDQFMVRGQQVSDRSSKIARGHGQ
jgi:hypothetical protein